MKTNFLKKTVSLLLVLVFVAGCTKNQTDKETIANLMASLTSEHTTNAKYNAYSEKAKKEGYPQLAKLFKALATAENVHALKFENALATTGKKIVRTEPVFLLESTEKNLQNAIIEEIVCMDIIYPRYLKQAESSFMKHVENAFWLVNEAEKSHKDMLVLMYDVLVTNVVKENDVPVASVPSKSNLTKIEDLFSKTDYFVCPVDGRVFDETNMDLGCSLCETPKSKFIRVSDNSEYVQSNY